MTDTGGVTAAGPMPRASGDVPVDIPRVPAREAAERELSKPMYQEHEPHLLQRASDAFWDWIDDLFTAVSGAAPGGFIGIAVTLLIIAALIGALWWRLGTPQRLQGPARDVLFDGHSRTAAQHRATAEAHAAALRWNPAVQERMRAIVRALEERALLDHRPGRTADEAAAEASLLLPGHAEALQAAARAFDDITYGGRTADTATYGRLRDLDGALERATPSSTRLLGAVE
ncbi:DUF4129 domain-containing protein [Streptomyces sp. NPDC057638]|uniref:DUF4129 domain-containing protein n=1 Tax=Streptomyces sp. NPDC057638 TaxID=3346190 RepID=UPI0036BA99DF